MAIDYEKRKRVNTIIISVFGVFLLVLAIAYVIGKRKLDAERKAERADWHSRSEASREKFRTNKKNDELKRIRHDSLMKFDPHYRDSVNINWVVSRIDSASQWLSVSNEKTNGSMRMHGVRITARNDSYVTFRDVVVEYTIYKNTFGDKVIVEVDSIHFPVLEPESNLYKDISGGFSRFKPPLTTTRVKSYSVDPISLRRAKQRYAKDYQRKLVKKNYP